LPDFGATLDRLILKSFAISGQSCTTETNDRGELVKYTYPDSTVFERDYTDRGELWKVKQDSTVIDTRTYDDGGRMLSSTYDNGVTDTRAYNSDNTLASIDFGGTGNAIGDLTYGWDANKNKTSETIAGVMSGYSFTVPTTGYDDEDRLVDFDGAADQVDQSWNLSLVGDWDSVTTDSTTQNRTHGPTHELLTAGGSSVTHDAKGNMTSIPANLRDSSDPLAFNWDFDNRMKSADTDNDSVADVFYEFDALGRRVARDDGTQDTIFVQVGQQTIADYVSGTAAASPETTYAWGSYIDELILRTEPSGTDLHYHRNQQYSTYAVTNSTGDIQERYAYSPYGELTITDASGTTRSASTNDTRYTYTGREWDAELGLYHFRARMYGAICGRFLERDSIGFQQGPLLYGSLFGLQAADPSGKAKIHFEFNAFIDGNRGKWLPEPVTNLLWAREFKTNERTFGENGTQSKVFTHGDMDSCAIGFGVPAPSNDAGTTWMRRKVYPTGGCDLPDALWLSRFTLSPI
jgi:RHS repeat-associated protein